MAALIGLLTAPARADDAFLSLSGLGVSRQSPNHDGWVNLLAAGAGLRSPAGRTSGGPSPTFSDIVIVKEVDSSSPILAKAVSSGRRFQSVQIDFTSEDGFVYGRIVGDLAHITGYHFSLQPGDLAPTEEVSLSFSNLRLSTTDRLRTGTTSTTYNLDAGTLTTFSHPVGQAAPAIQPVESVVLRAGEKILVPVRVSDSDTPAESIALEVTLADPSVLPADALKLSGSGPDRLLTIAAPLSVRGASQVRLRAEDGSGGSGEGIFSVLVIPPDGGTISITQAPLPEHSPAGTVVGALELATVPPAGPVWRLLDSAGGRFRLEADKLVVNDPLRLDFETVPVLRPVAAAYSQTGALLTASILPITLTNVPEGVYDLWRAQNFTGTELLNARLSASGADADEDNTSNVVEYALGLPPRSGRNPSLPTLGTVMIDGSRHLTLTYTRRRTAEDPLLTVEPEVSRDGSEWAYGLSHFVEISRESIEEGLERIVVRTAAPITQEAVFFRLNIVR